MKKIILIALMIVATATVSHAGGFNPGGNTPGGGSGSNGSIPQVGNASQVPFDGGLSIILIAAGAGVAKRRKQAMQNA